MFSLFNELTSPAMDGNPEDTEDKLSFGELVSTSIEVASASGGTGDLFMLVWLMELLAPDEVEAMLKAGLAVGVVMCAAAAVVVVVVFAWVTTETCVKFLDSIGVSLCCASLSSAHSPLKMFALVSSSPELLLLLLLLLLGPFCSFISSSELLLVTAIYTRVFVCYYKVNLIKFFLLLIKMKYVPWETTVVVLVNNCLATELVTGAGPTSSLFDRNERSLYSCWHSADTLSCPLAEISGMGLTVKRNENFSSWVILEFFKNWFGFNKWTQVYFYFEGSLKLRR